MRMALSAHVQAALPGEAGAFAAAVMSGDRSGMGQGTLQALRDSNLAHLLAISGLHMGLLAGVVFAALRLGLLVLPGAGLRWPIKKIAALGALAAAAFYLALSGGNVATERAFVMVAVMLGAVVVDRRAISLRAVAMAALIVLVLRPESLLSPGFQMSFAATTALVAVFSALRDLPEGARAPGWAQPILATVISSAVAGAATAPVAMVHFNRIAHYGLLANLASVPLMGLLVMPAAVLAVLLLPLGLSWPALWLMGLGLRWILWVAHKVAGLEGAVGHVPSPPMMVLPVLALGLLLVFLWQGRLRWVGIAPALLAGWLWLGADRPAVLIADDGRLVGVMTDDGRALSKPKGAGFVARVWLENDGDGASQVGAAARWQGDAGLMPARNVADTRVTHLLGKRGLDAFAGCSMGEIVITSEPAPAEADCRVLDRAFFERHGAVALHMENGKLDIVTARDLTGDRLWHPAQRARTARLAQVRQGQ